MAGEPALEIRGISKNYGPTRALDDVRFSVECGTVHALLGGNGSGKSTLIKILAGVEPGESGEVLLAGRRHAVAELSPDLARTAGIHVVHQQSTAFPGLSVAENLQLGHGFTVGAGGRIRWREARRRAAQVLERFGVAVDPEAPIDSLGRATQTMVAIARALQDQEDAHEGVLILDEPTSSLPVAEVDLLLDALRRYAADGQTILFVTHQLDEVSRVADRLTVLRDGRHVATLPMSKADNERMIELMIGRRLDRQGARPAPMSVDSVLLSARALSGGAVTEASFELGPGEIVGVAGLLGSGRSTLLRLLFGLVPQKSGEVTLEGDALSPRDPREAMDAGVAYVPEDRATEGAFADLSVSENLSLATTGEYWHRGHIDFKRERIDARRLLAEFDVKAASEGARFASLSGGNQQKVILARWMRRKPRLLLLDEPSQGVDVGARVDIYDLISRAAAAGAAVLVVSSELEELEALCHRALVMRQGRIFAQVGGDGVRAKRLESLAHGGSV